MENFLSRKSDFEKFRGEREAQGWVFSGRENLTRTRFSDEAKFEEVPFQNEEKIKAKHLDMARNSDPSAEFEVELTLDENTERLKRLKEISEDEEYVKILENLRPEDKRYFVWVRKVEID